MMDINRLCPGCMREMGAMETAGIQDVTAQGTGLRNAQDAGNRECGEWNGKARDPGKCPHCGFDAAVHRENSRCLPLYTILAGKYLVGAVLGEGGFGITYIGYDLNMQTRIAIKEYFPVELVSRDTTSVTGDRVISISGDKSATYRQGLKKYVAEARNVSQFSEIPGVVSVKDFFYENETAYIVMEYIDGISLKDYLKERGGRLSEEESLAIMKPVLEALVKVHEAGIVHRDISPDNIMLTFEKAEIASVKLIDFGAARMTAKNDQKSLTIILKHGYAPEEQYRTHGEQGPWTDVYAVCAVLYRMLTGQTPVPAMDRMFQDELKSIDDLNAKVSRNTQAAILKGLAVKKEDRIQSAEELVRILYQGKKMHLRRRNPKVWIAVLSGAAALGITAAAGSFFLERNRQPEETVWESLYTETPDKTGAGILAGTEAGDGQPDSDEDSGGDGTVIMESSEETSPDQPITSRPEILEKGYKQIVDDYYGGISLIVRENGTVSAQSPDREIAGEVREWTDICAVATGSGFCAGLRTDGTVKVVDKTELSIMDAERWKDVISVTAGSSWLIGLCLDGTVLSAGDNSLGQCEVSSWTQIQAIGTAGSYTVGVKEDGTVVLVGQEMAVGRKEKEAETGERMIGEGWEDVVQLEATANYLYGLSTEGAVKCINIGGPVYESYFAECRDAVSEWPPVKKIFSEDELYPIVMGIREDGMVEGYSAYGIVRGIYEDEICGWTDIEDIENFGTWRFLGIRRDGTVVKTRLLEYGSSPASMENLLMAQNSERALVGLTKEGEILLYGMGYESGIWQDITEWKDLAQISLSSNGDLHISGIDSQGSCMFWGGIEDIDSFRLPDRKAVQVSEGVRHRAVLLEDGTVEAWGYSDLLGTDRETGKRESGSCDVEAWKDMCQIAAIREATIGLTKEGRIVAAGDYPAQILEWENIRCLSVCGISSVVAAIEEDGTVHICAPAEAAETGQTNLAGWDQKVTSISPGSSHTVGLMADGTVRAVGSNAYGQCEVDGWNDVIYIHAGVGCTLGITESGELLIAGTLDMQDWRMEDGSE